MVTKEQRVSAVCNDMARLGCLFVATLLVSGSSAVRTTPVAAKAHTVVSRSVSALTPLQGSELDTDFLSRRRAVGTQLLTVGPAPDLYCDPAISESLRLSRYSSHGNELKLWQLVPEHKQLWSERGYATLIYIHDGTTLTQQDVDHAETFREAGFFVVLPTFRGENGNPGIHELLFGELEDLVAATHVTRALPEVDPTRLGIFGHGTGGMLSALASLVPQLPVQRTVSSAGLRPESAFLVVRGPFIDDVQERRLRLFGPNIHHMQAPHVACVAEQDPAVYAEAQRLFALATEAELPLELLQVPGSRSTSREECERRAAAYLSDFEPLPVVTRAR